MVVASSPALPDRLGPGVDLLVVGGPVTACAAALGHWYAGPGNAFWQLAHDAGLTRARLSAADDVEAPDHGVGLTAVTGSADHPDRVDLDRLVATVARVRPRRVALHGKGTARSVAVALGERPPSLGPVPWDLAGRPVFVLPSASGANRRRDHDGRPQRLDWWRELGDLLRTDAGRAGARTDARPASTRGPAPAAAPPGRRSGPAASPAPAGASTGPRATPAA